MHASRHPSRAFAILFVDRDAEAGTFAAMASPRDALIDALLAWMDDEARERVARARGDEDADAREVVLARHAALRGPRAREAFEEARERGLLEGDELARVGAALREAYAAVGHARAEERFHAALGQRVPHDSDHHAPVALLTRMLAEPHAGRRRAMARSLEGFAPALLAALKDGRADVEESLEPAGWLPPAEESASTEASAEAARQVLRDTGDLWDELRERVAHASKAPLETESDLLFALRAPSLDDRFDRARRWRRLATHLAPLGVAEALGKRARVEATVARLTTEVLALRGPSDVRVLPATLELGLASERDAILALGRATALAWTHPALSPLALRREGPVGVALGALFAHLLAEPRFPLGEGLSDAEARALRELAAAIEIVALRSAAACALARRELASHAFADAARELVREAWQVDVHPTLAACAALREPPLDALRFAPALFVALRERYDEDFWRNPRAIEPIRAACERGPGLTLEAWAAELGASPSTLASRLAERL